MFFAQSLYASRRKGVFKSSRHADHPLRLTTLLPVFARHRLWASAIVIVSAICGAVYAVTAVPYFTAEARLLIDDGSGALVSGLTLSKGNSPRALASGDDILDSIEVIRSETIAERVVDKLDLHNNPLYRQSYTTFWQRAGVELGFYAEPSAEASRRAAISHMLDSIRVSQIGRSRALLIKYTTTFAPLASTIVNEIATTYILDRENFRYATLRPLQAEIDRRRENLVLEAQKADMAMQQFKTERDLVARGNSVSLQQVRELSRRLIAAQSELSDMTSREQRMNDGTENQRPGRVLGEGQTVRNWDRLLAASIEAKRLRDQIAALSGENHERVKSLDRELAAYEQLMREEHARVGEGFQSEVSTLAARIANLETLLGAASSDLYQANIDRVYLSELNLVATAKQEQVVKFEQFANRVRNLMGVPDNPGRIVRYSNVPGRRTGPPFVPVVGLSILAGFVIAGLTIATREISRRGQLDDDHLGALGIKNYGSLSVLPANQNDHEAGAAIDEEEWDAVLDHIHYDLVDFKGNGCVSFGFFPISLQARTNDVAIKFASQMARAQRKVVFIDFTTLKKQIDGLPTEPPSGSDATTAHQVTYTKGGLDVLVAKEIDALAHVNRLIAEMKQRYDFVVVGTPSFRSAVAELKFFNNIDACVSLLPPYKSALHMIVGGMKRIARIKVHNLGAVIVRA